MIQSLRTERCLSIRKFLHNLTASYLFWPQSFENLTSSLFSISTDLKHSKFGQPNFLRTTHVLNLVTEVVRLQRRFYSGWSFVMHLWRKDRPLILSFTIPRSKTDTERPHASHELLETLIAKEKHSRKVDSKSISKQLVYDQLRSRTQFSISPEQLGIDSHWL
jgi:hypothetical protein